MPFRSIGFVLIVALAAAGCAGRAWNQARSEDSVAAYHKYLRDHEGSKYEEEARARLEFARVRNKPSVVAFERFQKKFPGSPLIAELRPFVEEKFFTSARARGTAAAYREFLAEFPSGAYVARAEGNAIYLESNGFGGKLDALAAFAESHPESDYTAEAQRSVAAVSLRDRGTFRRVALVLDIDPATPGADRLARVFTERAARAYSGTGIDLVGSSGHGDPRLANVDTRLVIAHTERQVRTELEAGQMAQPGILASTTVTLARRGSKTPVWSDTFEHRVSPTEHRADVSILFGAGSTPYWSEFFVPIATWENQVAVRDAHGFAKPPVALEIAGSRAIVLFGDGDFQIYDLGDPASLLLLGEYRRSRDLAKFDGVHAGGGDVVVFGPDGIEIVRLGSDGPERVAVHGREEVGSVVEVVRIGRDLVVASNHGLLATGKGGAFQKLVPRPILGLARLGDRLLFTDGTNLYVATLSLLRAGRIESELRIGRGFGPRDIRVSGTTALVLGQRGVLRLDASRPSKLRLISRIETTEVGEIEDAVAIGGRVFLLGARGLQVSDRTGERVVDSVDVAPRERLRASGRHLVAIGADGLQVVDATPFFAVGAAASPGS